MKNLFCHSEKVKKEDKNPQLFYYALRHGDDDMDFASFTIEKFVFVNRYSDIITNFEIKELTNQPSDYLNFYECLEKYKAVEVENIEDIMFELKQQPGVCPVCGSDNIKMGQYIVVVNSCYAPWECQDCKTRGEEHNEITFNEHKAIMRENVTPKYKIVRFYSAHGKQSTTIKTGLTLEEAQQHCGSSNTQGVDPDGTKWFDGFEKELEEE
jgi:hypothetical protein